MKTVHIYKAQNLGSIQVKSATIVIDEAIPDTAGYSWDQHLESFQGQAEMLADTLRNSLPGGVLDRLTSLLLADAVKESGYVYTKTAKGENHD